MPEPTDTITLSEALSSAAKDPYQGQYGNVQSSVAVAQPPAELADPFQQQAAAMQQATPEVRATLRPMNMERMQNITPEQPSSGNANPYAVQATKETV